MFTIAVNFRSRPMPDDNPQHVYTPQALEACQRALRIILIKIGPWGGRVFLIGGMTPRYLIGTAPVDVKEHIGTTDLDIVVGVTVTTEEEELYRTLQNNLKDAGFGPAIDPETSQEQTFRWTRDVDGIGVFLEFFCPVGDGQAGRALRNPGKQVGSRISAMRMPGGSGMDCAFPEAIRVRTLRMAAGHERNRSSDACAIVDVSGRHRLAPAAENLGTTVGRMSYRSVRRNAIGISFS